MEDVLLVAILVAAFALVIGLIQAINRMLERGWLRSSIRPAESQKKNSR